MTRLICFVLFTAIAAANLLVSRRCLACKNQEGKMLGHALGWAALVSLSYMVSILTYTESLMSVSSGIHFACIDGMLFSLMRFFFAISGENDREDPAFCRACEQELARDGQRSLMLMLDVDGLKKYNDTHGHPQGDELLLSLAQALSAIAGTDGLTGRVGGDEFCYLLPLAQDASLSQIRSRSEQIVLQINAQTTRFPMGPTVSTGAAFSDPKGSDFNSTYAQANRALHIAKGRGKAQLCLEEEARQ